MLAADIDIAREHDDEGRTEEAAEEKEERGSGQESPPSPSGVGGRYYQRNGKNW